MLERNEDKNDDEPSQDKEEVESHMPFVFPFNAFDQNAPFSIEQFSAEPLFLLYNQPTHYSWHKPNRYKQESSSDQPHRGIIVLVSVRHLHHDCASKAQF